MKAQKGITLIALVLTAIVMLILAGIGINMALGDNGILGKSKNARREKIVAEKIEEVKMAIASVVIENNGDETSVIISAESDTNVIPKIKDNYFKDNEKSSISGLSTNEMQEEGMDDFDEDELLNLLGMVKYGKASTGLSEELMLIVDKDFNVEEYVGGVVSPYSDLPKVAIEPSTYKKVGNTWCNSPDLSGFNPESTYYVVYEGSGANETEKIAGRIDRVKAPTNWYYYGSKSEKDTENDPHWANVVTVTGNNVTYWTWIPRYKYTADENNQVINVEFVSDKDECKNSNDENVTLSSDYVLPKSFWFGEDADLDNPTKDYANLNGYWLSKYEVQDIELPELEQITQERHKNSIEISTIRSNANLQNGTIEGPSGRYRIYVEGVEVEAKDYNKSTGVTLPYTIKGLRRTKKYDICVESIDRNKMIGRTTGLSSNNIKVDKSGFNPSKTYYVTYEKDKNGNEVEKIAGRLDAVSEPENWYNYDKKIWANLVTVNEENITYWTYIPRYQYKEASNRDDGTIDGTVDERAIQIEYIPKSKTTPDANYAIPKSFRFGDDGDLDDATKTNYIELDGYWLSKYEVQQSELHESELLIKLGSGNKIKLTTTNPTGEYTVFVDGKKYNEEPMKFPKTIDVGTAGEHDIMVLNETNNRIVPSSRASQIVVDLSGFNPENTYYITYDENGEEHVGEQIKLDSNGRATNMPVGWYDYDAKIWANIVTVNEENVTYWTYIPRYEYKADTTNQTIDAKYIPITQTTPDPGYSIPKSFRFGDDGDLDDANKTDYVELYGYWLSKYEVQQSEMHDKELMLKTTEGNKVTVTTTKPEGTYTIYVNGEKTLTNKTLPQEITVGADGKCEIMLINETDNRIVAESRVTNIEVDLSGFEEDCTYYVEYGVDKNGNETETYTTKIQLDENGKATNMPKDWYDYDNKKWANIVTINKDENNSDKITYWTYIPRYEYREVPGKEEIDVKYIPVTQTSPDPGYTIPKSFRFGDDGDLDDPTKTNYIELKGYWLSKYEVQQ